MTNKVLKLTGECGKTPMFICMQIVINLHHLKNQLIKHWTSFMAFCRMRNFNQSEFEETSITWQLEAFTICLPIINIITNGMCLWFPIQRFNSWLTGWKIHESKRPFGRYREMNLYHSNWPTWNGWMVGCPGWIVMFGCQNDQHLWSNELYMTNVQCSMCIMCIILSTPFNRWSWSFCCSCSGWCFRIQRSRMQATVAVFHFSHPKCLIGFSLFTSLWFVTYGRPMNITKLFSPCSTYVCVCLYEDNLICSIWMNG